MNTLTIVGLGLLLALLVIVVVFMGLAALEEQQDRDDERMNAMFDRIEREPAYLETVSERLKRESRRGR